MYAIFQFAGMQFRAEEGEVVRVPRQKADQGGKLNITDVLMVKDDAKARFGTPTVPGATIEAEVITHGKGEKILMFKYKRRTKSRRTRGHRQDFTDIKINKIHAPA